MIRYRSEEERTYARVSIWLFHVFGSCFALALIGFPLLLPGPLWGGPYGAVFFVVMLSTAFSVIIGAMVFGIKYIDSWSPGEVNIALAWSAMVMMTGFLLGIIVAALEAVYMQDGILCLPMLMSLPVVAWGVYVLNKVYHRTVRSLAGARTKDFRSVSRQELELTVKGVLDSIGLKYAFAETGSERTRIETVFRVEASTMVIVVGCRKNIATAAIQPGSPGMIAAAYQVEDAIDRAIGERTAGMKG